MFCWRISIFGKTPVRSLGTVAAPNEAAAKERAIEFFGIEPAMQFRVVAVKLGQDQQTWVGVAQSGQLGASALRRHSRLGSSLVNRLVRSCKS
jgi:hypothetical protein